MAFRPEFRSCYRAEVISPERVVLHSDTDRVLLTGTVYSHITPLLDGRTSLEEIIRQLHDRVSPLHIFSALDRLRARGYVEDAGIELGEGQRALWDALDSPRDVIARNLRANSVRLTAFGSVDVAELEESLASAGVQCSEGATHHVVLTDDYLNDELSAFGQARTAREQSWLLCKPVGRELLLGPLFVPGDTGCFECLRDRLLAHRATAQSRARGYSIGLQSAPVLQVAPVTTAAISLLTLQIVRWLAEQESALAGHIISLDALDFRQTTHILTRRPQCRLCGEPERIATRQRAPVRLTFDDWLDAPAVSSEQALESLEYHISDLTGIVREIHSLTLADARLAPVNSTVADHVLSEHLEYGSGDDEPLQSRSGGKGRTGSEARLSALCEAIERYSCIYRGDEAQQRSSAKSLGNEAIHPNSCMLFSDRQFLERAATNVGASRFDWVPEAFDEAAEVDWSPVWSLTADARRYIPTAFCFYGHETEGPVVARANSNGCAAGQSLEMAVLRGALELIERDSVAIWWYNRLRRPAVDLESFKDDYITEIRNYYHRIGRELWVLDITSDIQIPVFAALSRRTGEGPEDIILGFGADLDAAVAVRQAIVELNQTLPSVYPHSPHDADRKHLFDTLAQEWWSSATVLDQAYLLPSEHCAATLRTDYDASSPAGGALQRCLALIEAENLEVCVLDHTQPDTDLAVARVIVPGLRPFWARFAEGRLYDVPVRIGQLRQSLAEDQLNPRRIYF